MILRRRIGLLALLLLFAAPSENWAGDFFHLGGEVRDGGYGGGFQFDQLSDYQSGPGLPDYPGSIQSVALLPWATAEDYQRSGQVEFYQTGWAAETPGAFIPWIPLVQQGQVEFAMTANVFAGGSTVEPGTLSVGQGLGAAFVETTTSVDGLTYELVADPAFGEDPDDYIRVQLGLSFGITTWVDNDQFNEPYFDFESALDGEVVGPGLGGLEVLLNDEVVWTSDTAPWDYPVAGATIDARYGDVLEINGGVAAYVQLDSWLVPEDGVRGASCEVTLEGSMTFDILPGSKSEYPIVADNVLQDAPWFFDPIDLSTRDDRLGIDDPIWLATDAVPAYQIDVEDSDLVGLELEAIGDGVCDILLLDDETGEPVLFEQDWLAGEPLYLPPGTKTVIVAGFEADPFYFLTTPIGLMFEPYSMPLVTMTPVPEPSAWSLAIVALAAMLLRRRR